MNMKRIENYFNCIYHNTSASGDDSQIRAQIDIRGVFNNHVKTFTTDSFSRLLQIAFLSEGKQK